MSSLAASFKAIPSDRLEVQFECSEYTAALSSLSPPVCPHTTNAHAFDVRTWHRSHQAASARLRDHQARCPLVAIFCRPHPMYRNTSAPPRGATTKANITQHFALRPADGHITNIAPQQSHSNFNVAIKRSVCSRGLVVGLANTSCCGVCGAQPDRKRGEGWPLPLRQAKR